MKAKITELGQIFHLEITPEDIKDASQLVRMALNIKKVPARFSTFAFRDGALISNVTFSKKVESVSKVA